MTDLKQGQIPVTIVRSKWARKKADGTWVGVEHLKDTTPINALLTPVGGMCCMGFACSALGVPDSALLCVGLPSTCYFEDVDMKMFQLLQLESLSRTKM